METNFIKELDSCENFSSIFSLVKKSVKKILGKRRIGLILGLADLPLHIGAYHIVGSNFIVMNKIILNEVQASTNDKQLRNAYIFYILLHEYLHALGYVNEKAVRELAIEICKSTFGADHSTTQIAIHGIASVLPNLQAVKHFKDEKDISTQIEIVKNFENDIPPYVA
jgi:hypothetical protein